jgi:rhamnogalacturonan endolyase
VTLNDSAWISGDLLVPGTPSLQLNGLPGIAGAVDQGGITAPKNYAVTMNGQSIVRYLLRCVEPLTIQAVPAPLEPAGTRNVTLNSSAEDAGNFATVRDIAVTGGTVAVPAGTYGQLTVSGRSTLVLGTPGGTLPDIYNLQNLTVKAGSRLRVVGPVLLILGKGADVSGSLGDAAHAPLLTVAIAAGGLTLERNAAAGAYVIAPSGGVTIASGASLTGEVIANSLTIDRDGELVEAAP